MAPIVYEIVASAEFGFVPSNLVMGHAIGRKQIVKLVSCRGSFLCEEVGEGRFEVEVPGRGDESVEVVLDTSIAANLVLIDSDMPFCQCEITMTGEILEEEIPEEKGGAVVEQWQYDDKSDDKNVIPQPPSSTLPEESSIVIDAFVHAILFDQVEVIEKRLTTWGKQSSEIIRKNVNRPDMDGRRPLIVAAEKDRLNILQKLLRAGADPRTVCPISYRTPLHIAAHWGKVTVLLALLDDPLGLTTLNVGDDSL